VVTYRCDGLRQKIAALTEGEYALSKQEVDRLRQELGQPPLPSLQATLEEKSSECVFLLLCDCSFEFLLLEPLGPQHADVVFTWRAVGIGEKN
jgi:hypothetical protein